MEQKTQIQKEEPRGCEASELGSLVTPHFNQLTPAEAERLALLAEECGEVIQVVGKILRHGYESRHPNGGPTNRKLLEREIGDVFAAVDMLCSPLHEDLNGDVLMDWRYKKHHSVKQYLHHAG